MGHYSRPQLALLLVVTGVNGLGLAVAAWRERLARSFLAVRSPGE